MSIWTDLLFLHGHITTRTALALVTSPEPQAPAAGRTDPPVTLPGRDDAGPAATYIHHPLRVMGQVK